MSALQWPQSRMLATRKQKIVTLAAVIMVAIAGYVVARSLAAGPFAAVESETGAVTGNAKVVDDATASGGKAIQFDAPVAPTNPTNPPVTSPSQPANPDPTPDTGDDCALPAYPSPACTGMRAAPAKTHNGTLTITADGTVVDSMLVTGGIVVRAKNVVIKNSIVYGQIFNWTAQGDYSFTVMDSTVGPASGCGGASDGMIGANNYTAIRVHVRNTIDGFRVSENNRSNLANVTIQDSFVSVCSASSSDHSDGIQMYGEGRNVVIKHNTIDQRDSRYATAPIFGGAMGATIIDNLVMGGGYGIQIYDVSPATIVRNNRIVEASWNYKPLRIEPCTGVSGNTRVTIDASYRILTTKGEAGC